MRIVVAVGRMGMPLLFISHRKPLMKAHYLQGAGILDSIYAKKCIDVQTIRFYAGTLNVLL